MHIKRIYSVSYTSHEERKCLTIFLVPVLLPLWSVESIRAFEQEVQLYGDAYIADWVHDYSLWIAIMVCIYEISLAILALFGKFARLASVLFCISLMFFTYLTGVNLFFPGLLGSIESCGCFGELIHFSPLASFVKSLLLLGVSVLGIMVSK